MPRNYRVTWSTISDLLHGQRGRLGRLSYSLGIQCYEALGGMVNHNHWCIHGSMGKGRFPQVRTQMPNDETMQSVGFAFVNETTMRCLRCGSVMSAVFASALAHNEKREYPLPTSRGGVRGIILSECELQLHTTVA